MTTVLADASPDGTGRLRLEVATAIISLLDGHAALQQAAEEAEWLGVAVMSVLEYLASPRLTEQDQCVFRSMLQRVEQVDVVMARRERKSKRLTLPDALIAATALSRGASLANADRQILASKLVPCLPL